MENKYKLWIARERGGRPFLYEAKPILDYDFGIWFSDLNCIGTVSKNFFPELKWEDEPIQVELRSVITDIEAKAKKYANSITNEKELQKIIINAFKAGYKA